MIRSINPFNGKVLAEIQVHSGQKAENILEKGSGIYPSWKKISFEERGRLFLNCSGLLKSRSAELSSLISMEMGKRIQESEAEISKCAWLCEYYARSAEGFLRDEKLPVNEGDAYIAYDPLGLILAIMPWNFPFWQVFRFAAPTIIAGNTGLLKHASNVSQCALAIEKLFIDSGFPSGVFQTLLFPASQMGRIIEDDRVRAVTLTGSEDAGSRIAELAGRNLKKTVLELGGSDPFVILSDADLEQASKTAVRSRMINCGQSCISAKRFIVESSISERFLENFINALSTLKPGDPLDPATGYGPLARPDLVDTLEQQVFTSIRKGASLTFGGGRPRGFSESFYPPAVLTDVKPGMPAFDEELFGPVAAVTVAANEEEAIELANLSKFGLGASIWSADPDRAARMARRIESGTVFINEMVASHPAVPFGGIKKSGYGRELSYFGIREFMNIKSIWINRST
ncbi:MAG TPA: NAD-dependent succinate-semialdehyde dehydrogenase [Cyclobacteriaceae bacterium]|nr:NAD-dependent succinate-semialdehyde dehydrogenase [Cyclobacteriaceae bacterium]